MFTGFQKYKDKEKVQCICGRTVARLALKKHMTSKLHEKNLKNKIS